MEGKDLNKLPLSALQPASTSQIDGPKKRLVVAKRGDYPSKGFPHTLEHLQVLTLFHCPSLTFQVGGRHKIGPGGSTDDQAAKPRQPRLEQQ